jgi:hypothetical protein
LRHSWYATTTTTIKYEYRVTTSDTDGTTRITWYYWAAWIGTNAGYNKNHFTTDKPNHLSTTRIHLLVVLTWRHNVYRQKNRTIYLRCYNIFKIRKKHVKFTTFF